MLTVVVVVSKEYKRAGVKGVYKVNCINNENFFYFSWKVKSIIRKDKLRKKLVCWLRAMSSKKTNKKAPTNGFDTTTIDDRSKNVSRFTWYALNPPEKTYPP